MTNTKRKRIALCNCKPGYTCLVCYFDQQYGRPAGLKTCPECHGNGRIDGGHICHNCGGSQNVLWWQQEVGNG